MNPDGKNREMRRTLRNIGLVSAAAFVFAFSLVPMYRIACEKVFGIKLEQGAAGAAQVAGAKVDSSRTITVEFDGSVNSRLPWEFQPETRSLQVHPGQLYEVNYYARNRGEQAIVGKAAPSIAPSTLSSYFSKTECFCFTEQLLQPGESRHMPVRFFVSPDLPDGVRSLTLSYTFFNNEVATAKLAAAGNAGSHAASAP